MYILVSPCILHPELRATGITTEEDRECFARCIERCNKENIEIVELPCPETRFFGTPREPGPYRGRMDSTEFEETLDKLETDVRTLIKKRNEKPAFILGVNSSPTCGATKTYFTEVKSDGAGVFLKRFENEYQLVDVKDFAKF